MRAPSWTVFAACLVASCTLAPRDGQYRCPDRLCPEGFSCGADLLCHVGEAPDSGGVDAGAPSDGEASLDANPSLDGTAVDAPIAMESCAPNAMTNLPEDEDLDGTVDEGCDYAFGAPHVVLSAMPVIAAYWGAELTDDGLRLFTVPDAPSGQPVHVAVRASSAEPFAVATPLSGTNVAGLVAKLVTVTGDGTELLLHMTDAGGDARIYVSRLGGVVWSTPSAVVELDAAGQEQHPFVRRDGRELFLVRDEAPSGSVIYSYQRASRADAWASPLRIGTGDFPTVSADGRTLFYLDGTRALRASQRSSTSDGFTLGASDPVLLHPISGRAMVRPFYFAPTRELFFAHRLSSGSTVPVEAPLATSVFRAEVCRDGPCTTREITGCAGIIATDRLHCYRQPSGTIAFADAALRCDAREHLVSIHSAAEALTVGGMWLNAWLGLTGRAWQSGEAFLYDEFGTQPTADQCAHTGTGWPLVSCVTPVRSVVCERDFWPVF